MRQRTLRQAKPENLKRLAIWLGISVDGFNHWQIADLVHQRIQFGI
jgi:hypothetical protein